MKNFQGGKLEIIKVRGIGMALGTHISGVAGIDKSGSQY